MTYENLEGITSSRARLMIADLLSTRPRTLKELADISGISVQGVLKHLEKLKSIGILQEKRIKGEELGARKVYAMAGSHVGDFSQGDLTIVKFTKAVPLGTRPKKSSFIELERLAVDNLVQRRRIREEARRLSRMIDELVAGQARLSGIMEGLRLRDDEKLIVHTFFTEESLEEAENSLKEHYGLVNARRAIDRALGKVRGFGE